ncbi:MAG: hypothetical protein ACJ74H_21660 [Thermoanaerobaculia bacterium]
MLRRFTPVVVALLFVACAQPPVDDEVTVAIEKNDRALITAQTTFNDADIKSEARLRILEAGRFAALHGNDPWSARFGRVTAEDEETTVQKHLGELDRVTRSVRIPVSQLQQVFSDTNITVNVLDGEGWRELSFIPGGSIRATREQRKHFEDALQTWSAAAQRYFAAVHLLYTYLHFNKQRAPGIFANLMSDSPRADAPAFVLTEEEELLVNHVTAAMEEVATMMDQEEEGGGTTFAEEADLIYNPFPARMTVRVPGDIVSRDGFGKELVIEPIDLYDVITSLEGKWISPDPLAELLRERRITSADMARQEFRSTNIVQASEIADAIREKMERPKMYVVRWRE